MFVVRSIVADNCYSFLTHHLDIFLQAKKGKKSAKKATLAGTSAKAGRKDDLDAFGGGNYDYGDEFDDFM